MKTTYFLFALIITLFISGCDPLVTTFDDTEDAVLYQSNLIKEFPAKKSISVMTWNVRFGVARLDFALDACGDRVIISKSEVITGLEGIANKIKNDDIDIVLMQEVDVQSKRSSYVDQAQWLLNNTDLNYGAYASKWKSQIILADGIGRVDAGNLILSKWKLEDAKRHQLPLRGDQDGLTQLFYLRRNVLSAKVNMPGTPFYAVNGHLTAFATDDTKQKHISGFKSILDDIVANGFSFVAGGDLNAIPPNATKTDYCLEDQCEVGTYHSGKEPEHKEGAYFKEEITWLNDLYGSYEPAISLEQYGMNETKHYTHSPGGKLELDRKLDYLWTNTAWSNGVTHQDATKLSDHMPVTANWTVK
jgi:endonuclease/exonuclease/phosphatase family metal-dependent hydrolase